MAGLKKRFMLPEMFYNTSLAKGVLTLREYCVLWYEASNFQLRQIALRLHISETRVEAIIRQICRKLKAKSIKAAIKKACFMGILTKEIC